MARRADPDYVSGKPGRYEIAPRIVHPADCVCAICPRHRKSAEDWLHPIELRARRQSIYPNSRQDSAAYARQFKKEEEQRLRDAVVAAVELKRARAAAVPFGTVCDAYRQHLRDEGRRLDRAEPLIANIEALFGRW